MGDVSPGAVRPYTYSRNTTASAVPESVSGVCVALSNGGAGTWNLAQCLKVAGDWECAS